MTCKFCHKRSYSEYCLAHKPRVPIRHSKAGHKRLGQFKALGQPTKPLNQRGKHYYMWLSVRASWIEKNKADSYSCHYCGVRMREQALTLDHKISRARAPQLRYVLSNLVPSCYPCNARKGSIDHDDFAHDCPDVVQRSLA